MLVIDADQEDRRLIEDCAYTVELLIQALERDKDDIYDTSPVKIQNRVMIEK